MNIEELKRLASAIRITHDWWSESVSEAIPAVFYRAGGIEWAVVATQDIPKCAIPDDCDKHTFPALERARISNYVAAANPAAVLKLIAEVERVTKQRDELLALLKEAYGFTTEDSGLLPERIKAAIARAEG